MGMFDGLDPAFNDKLQGLLSHASREGIGLKPLSGYRSAEDQQRAIRQVAQRNGIPFHEGLYQTGIPGMAAPVGRSQHQHGAAIDWDTSDPKVKQWLYANAGQYGFRFPLPNSDDGHMELSGSRHDHPAQPQGQPAMPQMMPYAMPEPDDGLGLLGRLARGVGQAFTSPLFQAGAAMYNAGAEGKNVGGGLLAGGQAANQASQHQALLAKAERDRLAQAQRDALWAQLGSGQPPAWAAGLPAGTLQLARALGPDQGAALLTSTLTKNAEGSLERDKLAETKRYHDLMDAQNRQREEDMRAMRAQQADSAAAVAELRREQASKIRREAEEEAAAMGMPPPKAPAPAPVPPPPRNPNIRPQSFEGEADPNLIRTQAADPAPVAPVQSPERTIKVPPNPSYPDGLATPDEARRLAHRLSTIDKFRPVAQDILKQIEQTRDDKGLDKGARGEVDKGIVGSINHLARLQEIEQGLDRRYLDVGFRAKMQALAVSEKAGSKLSPEQTEDLQRYTAFRARSIRNMNTLLKEISGAAVTEQEFERIKLQEPDAGTGGWTDFIKGDSYGQFLGKLKEAQSSVKLAIARANWLRNAKGFGEKEIASLAKSGALEDHASLPGMQRIISREREKIEGQIRAQAPPGTDENQIRDAVRARMKGVFGI